MTLTPAQVVERALQLVLDDAGDGWTLSAYVVALGLERVLPDGTIESIPWSFAAPNQPVWATRGLLDELDDTYSTNRGED